MSLSSGLIQVWPQSSDSESIQIRSQNLGLDSVSEYGFDSSSISEFRFGLRVPVRSQSSGSVSEFRFGLRVPVRSQSSSSVSEFQFGLRVPVQYQSSVSDFRFSLRIQVLVRVRFYSVIFECFIKSGSSY